MKAIKFTALTVLLLSLSWVGFAQDVDQAYNFSENLYIGSARTLAMGNAFTAVGGDLGALSINPASSGVLRMSEFEISPSLITAVGKSDYLNSYNQADFTKFSLPSFAYSQHVSTGRMNGFVSFNFGFAFNRVKSFNSIVNASGTMKAGRGNNSSSWLGDKTMALLNYDPADYGDYNADIPWSSQLAWNAWLIEEVDDLLLGATENYDYAANRAYLGGDVRQGIYSKVTGGIDEFTVNFAGNWNDNFYFGVNINIYDVDYNVTDTYSEEALNSLDFESGIQQFNYNYWQRTVGTGIGLKAGFIYLPTEHLRIGATISTPTKYILTDYWGMSVSDSFDNGNKYNENTPTGNFDYQVKAPMRYSLGLAYTIGTVGLLSFDYEGVNYSKISMRDYYGGIGEFSADNNYISSNFKRNANIFRVGAEMNVTPGIALRGGYAYYDDARPYYVGNNFLSCGLGFRLSKGAYLDLAWQGQLSNETEFTAYTDYDGYLAPVGYLNSSNNKLLATLRFKF
ncbi:MAG: hypothetical protein IKX60_02955 [Bacteroidales bacterium]|nr:hypothetical protein [Bacteroidales bacterium]